jgi:hypothetical protein
MDRGDVFCDPRGEGVDQAFACGGNPGDKIGLGRFSVHGVKAIGERSRCDQRVNRRGAPPPIGVLSFGIHEDGVGSEIAPIHT